MRPDTIHLAYLIPAVMLSIELAIDETLDERPILDEVHFQLASMLLLGVLDHNTSVFA